MYRAAAALFAGMLVAGSAFAMDVVAPSFAVPVESVPILRAKAGGMVETAITAGDRVFIAFTHSQTSGFLTSKTKKFVDFRFTNADGAVLLSGQCMNASKASGLLNFGIGGVGADLNGPSKNSGFYTCNFKDQAESDYALSVLMPTNNARLSIGPFGGGAGDAYKQVKAKLLYKGVAYDAEATGPGVQKSVFAPAPLAGAFLISKGGQVIGQVNYVGGPENKGLITLPVADADGRDAVIFLAEQLYYLPTPD